MVRVGTQNKMIGISRACSLFLSARSFLITVILRVFTIFDFQKLISASQFVTDKICILSVIL